MPLPVAPALIVIHASLLEAVQLQPAGAVTVTVPAAPPATTFADVGEIVELHGAPACVTVKVFPPIVRVPVREAVPALGATSYVTEPLPVPDVPALIVIHASLLVAAQLHPVAAVTVTVPPVMPVDTTLVEVGEIVGTHVAAACVMVKTLPPIVSVPVRDAVVGFAVTL